jgi:DNA-binding NtrC family response regulator
MEPNQTSNTKSNKKIIIIDDEIDLLENLVRAVQILYPQTQGFSSSEAALEFLTRESVDLIVSDHNLGKRQESGLHLYKKCSELFPGVPFIVMSGDVDSVLFQVVECGSEYPQLVLEKPFRIKDFLTMIGTAINKEDDQSDTAQAA